MEKNPIRDKYPGSATLPESDEILLLEHNENNILFLSLALYRYLLVVDLTDASVDAAVARLLLQDRIHRRRYVTVRRQVPRNIRPRLLVHTLKEVPSLHTKKGGSLVDQLA